MNAANLTPVPLMRAVRGPVLLVTLGSLFAIDHVGAYAFSTTWPALLIVVGLLKLMERATASAS